MGANSLHRAKANKNDEFYTRYGDVAFFLKHFWKNADDSYFKGKRIYLPCDGLTMRESQFLEYFKAFLPQMGAEELFASGVGTLNCMYMMGKQSDGSYKEWIQRVPDFDGDFRDAGDYWKRADVIVTNPPFSIFREFIRACFIYDKDFIILGPASAMLNKELFPYIADCRVMVSNPGQMCFELPGGDTKKMGSVVWYTRIRDERWKVTHTGYRAGKSYRYDKELYPSYANYEGIEVSRLSDLPFDYDGLMGVPASFFYDYDPAQFEVIGYASQSVGDGAVQPSRFYHGSTVWKDGENCGEGHRMNTRPLIRYEGDVPDKGTVYTSPHDPGHYYRNTYQRVFIRKRKP